MENFNLGSLIAKYVNYKPIQKGSSSNANPTPFQNTASASNTPAPSAAASSSSSIQMGALSGGDRSVYIKDLLQLPRNMNELLFMLQKNLNQIQFNRLFEQQMAARRNMLSQMQAQILAQLQGLTTSEMQSALKSQINTQMASALKNLQLTAGQMISISDIAALIQTNGKDAVTKLILAMANAAKQGVNDLGQMKETAKLINASIALASTDNPAQTLKTLMLLYLPWLPLHEGAGFDLEIETSENKGAENESILIVTITTVNYGIIIATIILETPNSVHVNIECTEKFPKDELLLRLENEQKHYSMQSIISFDTKKENNELQKSEITSAKINMSHTNEINPYLLLTAHAIIRNTMELDRM